MRIAPIHQKVTPAVGVPIMTAAGTGKAILMLVAGLVLVGGTVAAAMLASQRVQQLMTAGDASPLEGAQASFADLLDNLRKQTLSQARMLVDDTRVRATVITPSFDEATVRDVLEDLRSASQATGLAVLDSGGKPLAVSGIAALEGRRSVVVGGGAHRPGPRHRGRVDRGPAGAGRGAGPGAQPA